MTARIDGFPGRPFEAVVHSTDASSGVALVMYEPGTTTVITLDSREYITAVWAKLVTAAGGDSYILIGADATLGTNEAIVRGPYAANGGFAGTLDVPKQGVTGGTLWVVSPAGVVDAFVNGTIRKKDSVGVRPDWKVSQVPGA